MSDVEIVKSFWRDQGYIGKIVSIIISPLALLIYAILKPFELLADLAFRPGKGD